MRWRWVALLVAALGAGAAALSLEPVVWHTGNRRFGAAGGYVLYPQLGDRLDLVCPGGGVASAGGVASSAGGVSNAVGASSAGGVASAGGASSAGGVASPVGASSAGGVASAAGASSAGGVASAGGVSSAGSASSAGGVSGYEWYKLYLVGGAQARSCRVPPGPAPLLTCDRPQRELRVTIKFQEFSPNLWGHEFRRMRDYYIITTSDGTPEGLENREGGACRTRDMRVTLRVGQRPGSPLEQEGAGTANQTSPPGPGPPPARDWLLGGVGGGAAALLALLGGGAWWCRRHRPPRPRPPGPAPPAPPAYYKV